MKIALVTDTHLARNDTVLAANWAVVDQWLRDSGPDIAVHLGDITANGVHDADELIHARALIDRAGQDFLFLPGNHDIGDQPFDDGQRPDDGFDPARLADYRRIFGQDWWSIHLEDWQIIGLNAQLFGTGSDDEAAQKMWLEEVIRHGVGKLGVMIHKPMQPAERDLHRASGRYLPVAAKNYLTGQLRDRDLRFVISGHTHQALRFHDDPTEHIWVPSTSFCIPDAMQNRVGEKCVGAALLELSPDGYGLTTATPPGLVRHNLLDLDHIYPQTLALRQSHGPKAAL